tara:strand:- start:1519 stop:1638 length:120 start_codon:yes stop_codon:yes gene_type:complete
MKTKNDSFDKAFNLAIGMLFSVTAIVLIHLIIDLIRDLT